MYLTKLEWNPEKPETHFVTFYSDDCGGFDLLV